MWLALINGWIKWQYVCLSVCLWLAGWLAGLDV